MSASELAAAVVVGRASMLTASPSFTVDLSADDYLPPQDFVPHVPPNDRAIAPWLEDNVDVQPPTPPPKSQLFGFSHRPYVRQPSVASLQSAGRHSETVSLDSRSTYPDPARTRKPSNKSSSLSVLGLIKKRSRSILRADTRMSTTTEPVPPLPSPDRTSFLSQSPPPATPRKDNKLRVMKNKVLGPSVAPKKKEAEFTLDTNLDHMEGIVNPTVLPFELQFTDPGSPTSGSHPSSSDLSSYHFAPSGTGSGSGTLFSNPFQAGACGSSSTTYPFDGRKVSPKSLTPIGDVAGGLEVRTESPSWTAPESWAVEKEGEDAAVPESSSSDESIKAPSSDALRPKRRRHGTSTYGKSSSGRSTAHTYKIRIYRANNTYHVVSIDFSVTVGELTPQLNKKLLLDPEAEVHRLYLKERGRERILALTERPAVIVRRRLEQAGYDVADGLDILGADDIQFLMKFVYKSNVLGPAEEELKFDSFDLVDLTGRSLRTVPVLLYPHADLIVSLNLSRNPMLEIPLDFIQSCTTLRELRLSNMAIKKVPQSVRHCKTLHRLDLSCNRIVDLDDAGLDGIPQLRSLKVQNNRLEKLPRYFPGLRALKDLNISNNKFQRLPAVVTEITNLVDLDISFNMMSELPEEIGRLHALERLIIVGNQVSKFPRRCSGLTSLRVLDCRRNNISDMSVVCTLPKVETLLADHNAMHALDLSIGPSLRTLDASHNDITQLTLVSDPFGQPFALTSLDISHAKLHTLDDAVLSQLTSLHTLRIDYNMISVIPDTLGDLTQLVTFSCSNNELRTLPATIGHLQKLETLETHKNNLKVLPASLWNCASLSLLNVTSNLLGSWHDPPVDILTTDTFVDAPAPTPSSLGMLSERKVSSSSSIYGRSLPPLAHSLEKLYLGENQLTEDVLRPLTLLKELQVLNLSFNQIQDMPPFFLKNLTKLRELYLSGNKLSAIPTEDLHRLTRLEVLFLNGNKLQTLPQELGKLKNLSVLDVGSNILKYNINNWEFDWNWNFNPNLRYLNLSGNKRLEIKPDSHKTASFQEQSQRKVLADFSSLIQLRVLGLMDVTTTFLPNIPDEHEDRRVRTSLSEVNRMAYGIADTLGTTEHLNMFDLVQPHFRDRRNEAIFAMFGRASHIASSNRLSKYLHDHFLGVFSHALNNLNTQKGEGVPDALRRAFLTLNKYLHDFLYSGNTRKMSHVSTSTNTPIIHDMSSIRSGASGVVLYFVDKTLYVANAGNALAVVSRQGNAELLSRKHDPFDRAETARIRNAEGWVSPKGCVNDEIDISRSFGFYYLLPVVNARPDVFTWQLSELDEFVIIGNRGLWDYVNYQTAVDIARTERADPMIAAQKLRDFAISYGAEGTTMIMVISVADLFNQGALRSRRPTTDGDSLIDAEAYSPMPRRKRGDIIINRDISRLDDEVSPPTGHLALVFTDIRNSTHLWEVNAGMPTAMVLHNNLLRRQLRLCGGYEVKTEGDAFMCSFPTALSALWWCLSVQVQLLHLAWPLEILECEDGKEIYDRTGKLIARGLSVRMGIHCGIPVCEPDPITNRMDYFGPMVNRSARITGSAAGGQIMCSADIIREINARILETEPETEQSYLQPPQAIEAIRRLGVNVVPVGEVKLKGLEIPEIVSLVYPPDLIGRRDLEAVQADPNASGSRVQFSVEQMRDLALLCIRLETLTSGRIYRPLPERKGSIAASKLPELECQDSVVLYGNPTVLLPTMDKASDSELMMLLDSLSMRIENALAALTLKHIVSLNRTDIGSSRRNGSGLDVRTLQQLLSFLHPT